MLVYSICYYYGKNKKSNISNHLNQFTKEHLSSEKEFVVVAMVDSKNEEVFKNIEGEINSFIKQQINKQQLQEQQKQQINFKVIPSWNWGGTINGLWIAYNYCKNKYNDDNVYIGFFEEDFGPRNIRWYNDALKKLNNANNKNIYVGESNAGRLKTKNDDLRLTAKCYENSKRLGNPEVWTDGGFYFSSLFKLKQIEDKIGVFHKGNPEDSRKENYILHGIDLGEVGFPTELHHNGFNFDCLNRNDYFLNEW